MEQGEEGVEVELETKRDEETKDDDEASKDSRQETDVQRSSDEPTNEADLPKKRKDGGTWPNLYEECIELVSSAVLTYALAESRQNIRKNTQKGKVGHSVTREMMMTTPIDVRRLAPIMEERKKVFARIVGEEPTIDEDGNETYPYFDSLVAGHTDDYVIHEIHDERAADEIVYSINLNHTRQRIEICFRGSVTPRDFVADADPMMEFFPNPVESIRGHPQAKTIGIHSGFTYYLNGTVFKLGTGKSKLIKDSVLDLQEKYPHYRIYLTGHSLGGALATLMTFELATTKEISKPVTCINVAAPMAGNIDFRHAFQALEKMGHVRCVRVANRLDIITGMPTRACWCCDVCCGPLCCLMAFVQSRRYWHVGALVLLHSDGTCDVSYKRQSMTYKEQLQHEFTSRGTVCRTFRGLLGKGTCGAGEGDFLKNHSCKEYMERMEAAKDFLSKRRLNQLYFRQSRHSVNSARGAPPLEKLGDVHQFLEMPPPEPPTAQQQQAPEELQISVDQSTWVGRMSKVQTSNLQA